MNWIDKNDKPIVTIYPLMKDSSTLMERLEETEIPGGRGVKQAENNDCVVQICQKKVPW